MLLIGGIGYSSHYFIFSTQMTKNEQILFQSLLTYLWVTYILAIYKKPGSPPINFTPKSGEWKRWCKKCKNYKPERSHHCKTCQVCVLKMDHHCPWTMNCVGHENIAHFLRFLTMVVITSSYGQYFFWLKVVDYYNSSDLPAYLLNKSEVITVIINIILNTFVLISVGILYIRCVYNVMIKGMTQIEIWDFERIESQFHTERIWLKIRKNYFKFYGKSMPILTSWKPNFELLDTDDELEEQETLSRNNKQEDAEEIDLDPIVPLDFTIDDLIFPYDLGVWKNLVTSLGPIYGWIFPWTKSKENGLHFERNEFMEDDRMGLPWPPDGGNYEDIDTDDLNLSGIDLSIPKNISLVKKRLDPRTIMKRDEWENDLGEKLSDFGVDIDADDENDDLQR